MDETDKKIYRIQELILEDITNKVMEDYTSKCLKSQASVFDKMLFNMEKNQNFIDCVCNGIKPNERYLLQIDYGVKTDESEKNPVEGYYLRVYKVLNSEAMNKEGK